MTPQCAPSQQDSWSLTATGALFQLPHHYPRRYPFPDICLLPSSPGQAGPPLKPPFLLKHPIGYLSKPSQPRLCLSLTVWPRGKSLSLSGSQFPQDTIIIMLWGYRRIQLAHSRYSINACSLIDELPSLQIWAPIRWAKLFLPIRGISNKHLNTPFPHLSHGGWTSRAFDLVSPTPMEKEILFSKPSSSLLLTKLLQALSSAQASEHPHHWKSILLKAHWLFKSLKLNIITNVNFNYTHFS